MNDDMPSSELSPRIQSLWLRLRGDETARRLVKQLADVLHEFKQTSGLIIPQENHSLVASTPASPPAPAYARSRRSQAQFEDVVRLARPLQLRDWHCAERKLRLPTDDTGQEGDALEAWTRSLLRVGASELEDLVTQPLKPISLSKYVELVPCCKASLLPDPPQSLTELFDVSSHPYAQTYVAKELLSRLDDDVKSYAQTWKQQRTAQLLTLQPEDVSEIVQKALLRGYGGTSLFTSSKPDKALAALKRLHELEDSLLHLRAEDAQAVEDGICRALATANCSVNEGCSRQELGFALRQLAGNEANADFGVLAVQLLSSAAHEDLTAFNPHLTTAAVDELLSLLAIIMMRTSRRALLAAAVPAVRALRAQLTKLVDLTTLGEMGSGSPSEEKERAKRLVLELQNKAGALAELLITKRYIFQPAVPPGAGDPASSAVSPFGVEPSTSPYNSFTRRRSMGMLLSPSRTASESARSKCPSFVFDPRFLVFESISTMILREEQVPPPRYQGAEPSGRPIVRIASAIDVVLHCVWQYGVRR
eukprot:scaffold104956_cov28-Tisochrysis_lutea.AAC.9